MLSPFTGFNYASPLIPVISLGAYSGSLVAVKARTTVNRHPYG